MAGGKVNAVNFAKMMRLLRAGSYTCLELAEATGLCSQTVRGYIGALHEAEVVYIHEWHECGGNRLKLPAFRIGFAEDAPKPKALPMREVKARYLARQKELKKSVYVPRTVWVGGAYASA